MIKHTKQFERNRVFTCALLASTALLQSAVIDTASSLPIGRGFASALPAHLVAEREQNSGDGAAAGSETTLATEPLESCMARWDAGTHMTKSAWRETCKRITRERLPYVKGPAVSPPR